MARNIGLAAAKGSYLQLLDADDELVFDKIEVGIEILKGNSEYKAHVCGVDYIKDCHKVNRIFPKYNYPDELLAHNVFPIHSLLFRKDKPIMFDTEIDYCEDWLFWVQELYGEKLYFETHYIGAITHIHEGNTMGQKDKMNEYQLYVQQMLKKQYQIKNRQLLINELKLLILHYFTQEKEQITNDIIKENSRYRYLFLSGVLSIPIIHQLVRKKIIGTLQKNLY